MRFIHHDLGNLDGGNVVLVTLKGNAANVRLMDSSNFSNYRAGRRHRFYGGHATKSPVRLQVPHTSHWHVAVDLGGLGGQVRSGVQVLPGPLKPIRERPLSSVPTLLNRPAAIASGVEGDEPYDVFVSHASEDTDAVVRPLAIALRSAGLRVWFDEFTLHIGDSLRQKIDPRPGQQPLRRRRALARFLRQRLDELRTGRDGHEDGDRRTGAAAGLA